MWRAMKTMFSRWVEYMGTAFVPMYHTDRSRPYRCAVPAPIPTPEPVPNVPYLSFGTSSYHQKCQYSITLEIGEHTCKYVNQ